MILLSNLLILSGVWNLYISLTYTHTCIHTYTSADATLFQGSPGAVVEGIGMANVARRVEEVGEFKGERLKDTRELKRMWGKGGERDRSDGKEMS